MSHDDKREPITGTVTEWHDIDGLGVITSEDLPGEVWVHFSHIVMKSPRNLTVGRSVRFTWEEFPQDGYRFRAVRVWPDEHQFDGNLANEVPSAEFGGYESHVELQYDDVEAE
ncbi:cold-shock protein [Microtetraspora fusca]|uniref:Cold-shock protein n=1 Tax=Microtetraspora fusca TaxID=1997 RepID=A0ABW6V7T1_MICFU|nr:cold shock domain-containing protein [Microtetraspora fusca]